MRVPSDAELVAAARAGDSRAGEHLARRYYAILLAYFHNHVDEDTALELTQTALLHTVARIERFRGESSFRAYALAIAWRVACDHFRGLARRPEFVPLRGEPRSGDVSLFDRLVAADLAAAVASAVSELPEHYGVVVRLRLGGCNNAEIRAELHLNYNTVRGRLSRGLAVVRETLATWLGEEYWCSSSSTAGP